MHKIIFCQLSVGPSFIIAQILSKVHVIRSFSISKEMSSGFDPPY
jgi:hypothetical protein